MLAGAAFVSVWRHHRTSGRAGWAVGAGLLVGVSATVASGWFYWRNLQLYGRVTAPDAPAEFARESPGSFIEVLTGTTFHQGIWSKLYASVNGPLTYVHAPRLLAALGVVLVLGFALAAVRGRSRVRSAAPDGRGDAVVPDGTRLGIGVAGWILVGCSCAAIVVGSAQFYSQGGAPYPRYLFPVVPVVSALLARAISELPCPRLVLAGVVGVLAAVLLTQVARVPSVIDTMPLVRPVRSVGRGARGMACPAGPRTGGGGGDRVGRLAARQGRAEWLGRSWARSGPPAHLGGRGSVGELRVPARRRRLPVATVRSRGIQTDPWPPRRVP